MTNHPPLVRKLQSAHAHARTHKPTSLAETGALQAVARLVCGGHQGLSKAAVGKDGAVGRAAQTGPVAGEITIVLRGRAPPIHHGPCGTPQPSAKQHLSLSVEFSFISFGRGDFKQLEFKRVASVLVGYVAAAFSY